MSIYPLLSALKNANTALAMQTDAPIQRPGNLNRITDAGIDKVVCIWFTSPLQFPRGSTFTTVSKNTNHIESWNFHK